jgi:hypothetical protein
MNMNTRFNGFWAALPMMVLFGCAAPESSTAEDGDVAESVHALGSFTFDSREISAPPAATLPTVRLTLRSFDDALVQRSLIQTTQPFTAVSGFDTRTELESTDWTYERDALKGSMLVVRKTPSGPRTTPDEALLQRGAIARLNSWGIPSSEIGVVLQRRTLREDLDGTATGSTPEVHRYKTFVFRALNGVRVQGHRAVVTHTLDGTFNRAFVSWPAIASSGHLMRTRLSPTEIASRAVEALTAAGETGGAVKLRWKYVPTALTSGEVALTLKVSALMGAEVRHTGVSEEPRETDVDISAL